MSKEKAPKFVPTPEFIQARLKYLHKMVEGVFNPKLIFMCQKVLNNPAFQKCTASRTKHQSYDGGLVVHTAEVLEAALQLATCRNLKVNYDVLVAAVIFHDFGKIWDYQITAPNAYEYTPHQELIRHLSRSYAEFISMSALMGDDLGDIDTKTVEHISHCILAHHGRKEWGSPAEPQTTEAYIIHFADMLSAMCSLETYEL